MTGAALSIGHGVAWKLAQDRFDIAKLDIREADETTTEIAVLGRRAASLNCNVEEWGSVEAVQFHVREKLGKPSVIVNCVGSSVTEPVMQNNDAFWDRAIDVNLRSSAPVKRVFIDDLLENNVGRVVLISSDAGRVGSAGEVVYSATKGGVMGFTKAPAREMERKSITVNCVCSGPAATPTPIAQDPKPTDALTQRIPMRRLAGPADIAAADAFFVGAGAGYITGQILSVSGGLTMGS